MKRLSAISTLLLVVVLGLFGCATQPGQPSEGWITLFDGTNLNSWNLYGNANWRLQDGIAVAELGNGHLVSKDSYGDFQIKAEFWVDTAANSGIFIRCDDPKKISAESCYEVNIFDTRPDPSYGTGGIPNVAKTAVAIKAVADPFDRDDFHFHANTLNLACVAAHPTAAKFRESKSLRAQRGSWRGRGDCAGRRIARRPFVD